jgi:hypothetical protein
MKFIKNIPIDQQALDFMLNNTGSKRPVIPPADYQKEAADIWTTAGYDTSQLYWESFSRENFPFTVDMPFKENWWFSKLLPGGVFPYHQDIYPTLKPKSRLWIACQDHQPGHIFSYGDNVLTGYKAGDVFEFQDTSVWHGAANCGLSPKISLQVVIFESS